MKNTLPSGASPFAILLLFPALACLVPTGNAQEQKPAQTNQPPAAVNAGGAAQPGLSPLELSALFAKPPQNEISISGDYLHGLGTVSVPEFLALSTGPGVGASLKPFSTVGSGDRASAEYYGGTISYSFGQAWYLDLSYRRGQSTGNLNFNVGNFGATDFTIKDTQYQAYFRYTFPRLRGTLWSAYLRGGVSYADSELSVANTAQTFAPAGSLYTQQDKITDILGNVGFGINYAIRARDKTRLSLQLEGEGFFGSRNQNDTETIPSVLSENTKLNNELFGGIGRATVRFEWTAGSWRKKVFKLFAEGGGEAKLTEIDYSQVGMHHELLYGPYAKAGLRIAF